MHEAIHMCDINNLRPAKMLLAFHIKPPHKGMSILV
jgi:hypothetical protein